MNKKILSASLLSALILTSANANAFYLGASVGSSKAKVNGTSLDKDASYSLYTGMSIPLPLIPIRGEVELLQLKSEKESFGSGKIYGGAANAYVGLPLLPIVKPYVGMGLAYVQEKFNQTGVGSDKSDWKVVPQYMIGLDLDLPLIPVAGGVEYRYMDSDFHIFGNDIKTKIHTVLVKGRFKF